jgi:release factor glutamine methyltransferase
MGSVTQEAVAARLRAAGCVAAEDEAAELLATASDERVLEEAVCRREDGEPLAWITGAVAFGGRRLKVAPGVYPPRPQTEHLAERAAARLPAGGWGLDLCTGCGAVAAHLAAQVPEAFVVGVDDDPGAAACARSNGVVAVAADLATAIGGDSAWDLVTAVPPYVPTGELAHLPADVQRHEPRRALDGGHDGLDVVRRVVGAAARLLRPGGWLLVEIGGDQDERLRPSLARAFVDVEVWSDAHGDPRGLAARRA